MSDPPIRVRPGRRGDLPALRSLQGDLRAPSPDLLSAAARHGVGVLLVADPRPVADGDESAPEAGAADRPAAGAGALAGYVLAVPGDVGWIAELVVAPAWRRGGVATALVERCCARLRAEGCAAVELAVAPENDAARSCYRSLGFEVVREEAEFYEDGPALIARRSTGE